jgi:hypothetical protein
MTSPRTYIQTYIHTYTPYTHTRSMYATQAAHFLPKENRSSSLKGQTGQHKRVNNAELQSDLRMPPMI